MISVFEKIQPFPEDSLRIASQDALEPLKAGVAQRGGAATKVAAGVAPAVEPGVSPGGLVAPNRKSKQRRGAGPGGGTRALYGSQDGRRYKILAGREDSHGLQYKGARRL